MPVDSRSKTANVEVDKAAMVMGHKGTKICPNYTLPSRSLHPVKILQYATKKWVSVMGFAMDMTSIAMEMN